MSYANELASQARSELTQALNGHSRVALLPVPENNNPGDAAIWWGSMTLLRALGVDVGYAASIANYDPSRLARCVPGGPVLIRGGGNFGDRYPLIDGLRTRILSDFTDRPVIQLPQSLSFISGQGGTAVSRRAAALQANSQVILFARESASVELARGYLGSLALLSPDHALALAEQCTRWGRQWAATTPVISLLRRDSESTGLAAGLPEAAAANSIDWPEESDANRVQWDQQMQRDWALLRLWEFAEPGSMDSVLPMSAAVDLVERVSAARVRRAVVLLCTGNVVVTDRLHAALLGWMLGREVVMLPNAYHKNRSVYETWFKDVGPGGRMHWADSLELGMRTARQLAQPGL